MYSLGVKFTQGMKDLKPVVPEIAWTHKSLKNKFLSCILCWDVVLISSNISALGQ